MPFSLKFLWSPLIQRFGDRRTWVTGAMLIVALVVALMPLVDPAQSLTVLLALVLVLTIAAATQDMAIDAYTVALVRREEQGAANGVRASAYRVALVLIGSGMVPGPLPALGPALRRGRGLRGLGLASAIPASTCRRGALAGSGPSWLDRDVARRPARPLRPHSAVRRVRHRPMVKPFCDHGRSLLRSAGPDGAASGSIAGPRPAALSCSATGPTGRALGLPRRS
jgi:MFS family permease